MKRIISLILTAALSCSLAVAASATPQLRGDANGDGKLNARDVIAVAKNIAHSSDALSPLADYNDDGDVNARDVISLMKYLTGHYEANDDMLELMYGCAEPEFDISDPVAADTVSGANFGFDTAAADNSTAFAAAASYLAAHPGTTLKLETGTYRMGDANVLFNGVKNCVIDGGGSRLLYTGRGFFTLWQCEGMKIEGLTIDWDHTSSHVASLARIKSVSKRNTNKQATVEFEFYKESDASYLLDMGWGTMFSLDPETLSPGLPGRIDYIDLETHITERELTAPNVITAKVSDSIDVKEGELYLLRHIQYEGTAFSVGRSSYVVFEDVTIHAGPGVGFIVQDLAHHIRWSNLCIEPDPDLFERIPMSTASDAINIRDCLGYFIIEDSSIGYCYDDCVNIRDNVGVTTSVNGNTLSLWTVNSTAFKVGDSLSFRDPKDYSKKEFTAVVSSRVVADNYTDYTLTLDRNCEGAIAVGDVVCDDSTQTAHVIIRDSAFHHNRSRGLLLGAPDCLVENCRLERNSTQAIQINVDLTEGSGVDNMIIRNNVFESCNTRAFNSGSSILFTANNPFSERRPTIYGDCFTNILIAHNRFIDPCGLAIQALSVRNLTVYANRVEITNEREGYTKSALGKIKITGSYFEDCRVLGNVWADSPYLPAGASSVSFTSGKGHVETAGNTVK